MHLSTENKVLIGIVVVTLGLLFGGAYYLTVSAPPEAKATVDVKETLSSSAYNKGDKNAKIKIVEYADFQCPACYASEPIIQRVLKEYEGKYYFEYHHYPLPMHKWAQDAAESAEAAGEQGKFWEYHEALFAKQNEWSEKPNAVESFKQYAKDLKLDEKKFNNSLDSHKFRDKVLDSVKKGNELAVSSTPTFFVNGKRVVGGLSYDAWKTLIEEELKK
ncbi:MAG: DsbA family protein [bacterium]|nr:DsbA family protein [bacterium]